MNTTEILDIPITSLSESELEDFFRETLSGNTFHHIATVNPEFLVETRKSQEFFRLLKNKTSLNLCDGFGIQLAGLFSGKKINRITGVQTAEILCKICEQEKKKLALIGGFGVAKKAKEFLSSKFPGLSIVYAEDGSPKEISQEFLDSHADAVLVAFGAPKQEFWLQKIAPVLRSPKGEEGGKSTSLKIGIGIGGTFDFWTKKRIRAPKFFQKIGLEWLWRLIQEPSRWKRIANAIFVFPLLLWEQKILGFLKKK